MTLLPSKTAHINGLSLLRMMAAFSVLAFHVLSRPEFSSWTWVNSLSKKGYLGVDLFFFISGFIVPYSLYHAGYRLGEFHRFIAKRTVRVEIPYIASLLIFFLMRFLFWWIEYSWGPFEPEWPKFFSHFLYINNYLGYPSYVEVYWTLALEFQFYFFIALTAPLLWSEKRYLSYAPMVALALASYFIYTPYTTAFIQYGFIFIAGILLFQYVIKAISTGEYLVLTIVALAFIYIKVEFWSSVVVLFGILTVLFLKREFAVAKFFGGISYSVYLVHLVFFFWVNQFIEFYTDVDVHSKGYLIAMIIGAVLFSVIFYRFVERPALKLSKNIKYKTRKVPVLQSTTSG